MASPEAVLSGGCKCGAVSYTSTTLPTEMGNCHCLTCRKLAGAPFLTFADFSKSSITWTSGPTSFKKTRYSDYAERAHCSECGSPIYMTYDHLPDYIGIAAGTIDEGTVNGMLPKADHHIFLDEKAGWYDLPADETGRYANHTPAFQEGLDASRKL